MVFVQFIMEYCIVFAKECLLLLDCTSRQQGGVWAVYGCCCRASQVVQRRCSVTSVYPALWIMEGWGFITFWLFWPLEGDGELWCSPTGRWDFFRRWDSLGNILFGRIREQSKKAACFPEEKERAEKVVGWGNIYERWPLSASFTSWLMLGVGVTYTNRASCMALHFADFNHSRVCLLQVVISFWSVNWDSSFLLESMQHSGKTPCYKNRTC